MKVATSRGPTVDPRVCVSYEFGIESEIGIVRGPRGKAERRLSMLCMRERGSHRSG